MNAKEAVSKAKDHIQQFFEDEKIINVGLEELEFNADQGVWSITIGFSRPWDAEGFTVPLAAAAALGGVAGRRAYKIVTMDESGALVSIKNRITSHAA